MADDINEAIEESAIAGIQSISVDGVQTQKMTLDEQIKAARYLASRTAAAQNHFGLRFVKLVPPGGG